MFSYDVAEVCAEFAGASRTLRILSLVCRAFMQGVERCDECRALLKRGERRFQRRWTAMMARRVDEWGRYTRSCRVLRARTQIVL